MRVELGLAHADVDHFPGRLADAHREQGGIGVAARVGDAGEAEVAVLLPIAVGDQVQGIARLRGEEVSVAQSPRQDMDRQGTGDQAGRDDAQQHAEVAPARARAGEQGKRHGDENHSRAERGHEPEDAL